MRECCVWSCENLSNKLQVWRKSWPKPKQYQYIIISGKITFFFMLWFLASWWNAEINVVKLDECGVLLAVVTVLSAHLVCVNDVTDLGWRLQCQTGVCAVVLGNVCVTGFSYLIDLFLSVSQLKVHFSATNYQNHIMDVIRLNDLFTSLISFAELQ